MMGYKNLKGNFQMKNSDILLIPVEKKKTCILISNLKYTQSMTVDTDNMHSGFTRCPLSWLRTSWVAVRSKHQFHSYYYYYYYSLTVNQHLINQVISVTIMSFPCPT